ncbi:hypothetical protein K431DRAFT_282431 [Polychaeton citri CBS 116435]|uniref:Sister chromatid cohesion protein Ctf8 n=1 Tax=Polychaeton citri CBS 116435 TaxID=1314669 RepID=A0A9P4QDE1_9PEZI|nr:hypothetical protein K431DRAFT_282431 [Polychaeton citri CBS 116435]
MPSTVLHPPSKPCGSSGTVTSQTTRQQQQLRQQQRPDGLPQLLQTPSGLALVEIQGTLNTSPPSALPTSDKADNDDDRVEAHASAQAIGRLVFPLYHADRPDGDGWQKRVHLYVGRNQRLTGEAKKLRNPIAVIRRRVGDDVEGSGSEELEVAEIVHYKLLFAHRPEPVGGSSTVH